MLACQHHSVYNPCDFAAIKIQLSNAQKHHIYICKRNLEKKLYFSANGLNNMNILMENTVFHFVHILKLRNGTPEHKALPSVYNVLKIKGLNYLIILIDKLVQCTSLQFLLM